MLVTLYGGNDGLNTVIPYEAGAYLGGRPQLGYQPSEVLPLGEGLGLHPNLVGLKELWDKGQVAIVRGVGYPNPNRSHFRSMDIWQSAAPDANVATGWVGRWLDTTMAFGHAAGKMDPLRAVSVGSTLPRIFGGEKVAGAAVPVGPLTLPGGPAVSEGFTALSAASPGASPLAARIGQVGSDLLHVQHAVSDMLAAHPEDEAAQAANAASAGGLEANRNALDSQLGLAARLIKAGSPTRVYGV
ncbi:MAG TPA: hypothetical protein VHA34_09550, partial [Actinomycetes bacterium]|nr:hypothetical protein [Actinomycetes bacterium]